MSTTCLYVANLPDVSKDDLRELFEKYGKDKEVRFPHGSRSRPRYAFVNFYDPDDAAKAVKASESDGLELQGKTLKVEFSRQDRPSKADR